MLFASAGHKFTLKLYLKHRMYRAILEKCYYFTAGKNTRHTGSGLQAKKTRFFCANNPDGSDQVRNEITNLSQ